MYKRSLTLVGIIVDYIVGKLTENKDPFMAKSELQHFMEIQRKVIEKEYSMLQTCLQKCGKQAPPFSLFVPEWIRLRASDFRKWFVCCNGEIHLDTFKYRPDYFKAILFPKPEFGK